MMIVPINPNAVEISTVPTGCCKTEFDSTYPIHLNGALTRDEFKESIDNINQAISSRTVLLIVTVASALLLLGGMALFVAGGITAVSSGSFGFPVLVGVGFGVFFLGMIVMMCGCIAVQVRFSSRLTQAIATESAKYSTRSLNPCSWRLHTSSYSTGGYNNRRTVTTYRIVIEIGNASYQQNQGYGQSFNPSAPPSYSGQSGGRFCSSCGAPRQNLDGRFCPSCGQPYNK